MNPNQELESDGVVGSLDGLGAADHDQPYRFGRRPRTSAPYPFSTRQYARLLRGRVQDELARGAWICTLRRKYGVPRSSPDTASPGERLAEKEPPMAALCHGPNTVSAATRQRCRIQESCTPTGSLLGQGSTHSASNSSSNPPSVGSPRGRSGPRKLRQLQVVSLGVAVEWQALHPAQTGGDHIRGQPLPQRGLHIRSGELGAGVKAD